MEIAPLTGLAREGNCRRPVARRDAGSGRADLLIDVLDLLEVDQRIVPML